MLSYTQIVETFEDGTGSPIASGTAEFTVNTTLYASGVPVLQPDVPIQAQIVGGALKSVSGGTLQLLDLASTSLSMVGQTGFWFWTVTLNVGGQLLEPWSFFLEHSPTPVDLFSLANTAQSTFSNPLTQLGDLFTGGAGGSPVRLPGNASAAREFLISQGTGTAAQAPAWGALVAGDIPSLPYDASGAASAALTAAETFATTAVGTETSRAVAAEALKAPLASPALTGTPTAPTASALTDSAQIATTAYADTAVAAETSRAEAAEALLAPKASPTFTGTVTVPNAASGTSAVAFGQLGSAAFQPSGAFDASGAAAAAQAASTPVLAQTAVQTANYTAPANHLVPVSTASGNVTVTLPNAPAAGTVMGVKMVTLGGSNTVTVACAGSDVFNKAGSGAALTLSLLNQGVLLEYQSGIWLVLSDDLPLSQLTALFDATGAAAAAAAASVPLSQSFALANNTYQSLQAWTVTGQTDSPLPSFGMVAGSATFSWEGGGESTQGPAFWFGYNPDHLSARQATSAHGAIGISCFADAGDTWNPATGGHGLEFNVVFTSGDGTKSIAFIETVAVDDSTGMGTLALRCGSGQFEVYEGAFEYVSEITASDIAGNSYWSCGPFANGGTSPGMNINQPVAFTNAPTFYVLSGAAQTVLFEAVSGTLSFYMTAAAGAVEALWTGTTTASVQATGVSSSSFVAEATTGLAYLWLNGNPSSGNVNEILFSKNAVQDWCVQDTGPVLQIVNASSVAEFALCGGYAYFPVAAGAPSGTPTAITGLAPVRIDSTNNKIWTYINGSWKGVVVS